MFSPGEGTWVLSGQRLGDKLSAERSRPSFDGKNYITSLAAEIVGRDVAGVYKTPSCTYSVALKSL